MLLLLPLSLSGSLIAFWTASPCLLRLRLRFQKSSKLIAPTTRKQNATAPPTVPASAPRENPSEPVPLAGSVVEVSFGERIGIKSATAPSSNLA